MTQRLYIFEQQIVWAGRVNMTDPAFPIADITFDGITVGSNPPVEALEGYTVLFGTSAGADDHGRGYIRRTSLFSDTLLVGYSSSGGHDGEFNVTDDDHITVIADRRVWSKQQRFLEQETEPFIVLMKDYDQLFENNGAGVLFYPKANAGPARAGTIDADTEVLTVEFDASESYSMPGGVGIASVLWDVGDGTITVGSDSDAEITATFPAGRRYVSLTVTDTNGLTHTMHTPVYARDPANDTCVAKWQIESWEIDQNGQRVGLRVMSDLPRSTYPDGAPLLIFDDDDPDHYCQFYGWHHSDSASLEFVKTGFLRDTRLECLDLQGKLDTLPAQAQSIEHHAPVYNFTVADDISMGAELLITSPTPVALKDDDVIIGPGDMEIIVNGDVPKGSTSFAVEALSAGLTEGDPLVFTELPQNWTQMVEPTLYLLIDYLLRWHSTALELADWLWPEFSFAYAFITRGVDANTIWQQVAQQTKAICPDQNVGCNVRGQLWMRTDPQMIAPFNRTDVVQATVSGHIRAVRFVHERPPRYQWIRGGAVLTGWAYQATTKRVKYIIRVTEFHDVGATTLNTYPLPLALADDDVLYLVGLGGQLLPWVTVAASASEGATSITIDALTDTVDVWSELQFTATEAGPDVIPAVYCIAPGLVPGQGQQTMTVNDKIAQNAAGLQAMIGHLYERLNSEYQIIDVELVDSDDLGIDPTAMTWVNTTAMLLKHLPQRALPFFGAGTRLLPISVSKSFAYDVRGIVTQNVTLRLERETVGIPAVELTAEDV